MQIDSLKIFCDIVEAKSFSRAAEKNYISQSAVSQQIAQFELEFKCQLVNRSKRPFELTSAGQIFYDSAKEIVSRYDKFKTDIKATVEKGRSRIKIGAIFSVGMHTLQPYIKKFLATYPAAMVDVEFYTCDRIYQDINSGEIDIGVVAIPKKDKNIQIFPFVNEPLVLVCSPEHPFAAEKSISIHKIQMQRFIAFGKDVPTRQWIDDILNRYSVVINPIMEFDNTETIKRALEINSGISILPKPTIASEVKNSTLAAIEFSNENFFRPTGVVISRHRIFTEPLKHLLTLLQSNSLAEQLR
jgi:DNA-binding transcriptional LysR family regulator